MNVKTLGLSLASALGLALGVNTAQAAISLDFSASPRNTIQFNGSASSFQLNPTDGPQFTIVNTSGGSGSAIGLAGWVSNGPWSYGSITTVGTDQTANVSGGGVLHISDGSTDLTGNVNWIQVVTMQSVGGVNANLNVNVSGISYSGVNSDLLSLASAAGGQGSMNISFQFSPGKSLTELTTGADAFRTSYSGSISSAPVPEPTTAAALFGVAGLLLVRRRRSLR